MAGNRRGCRDLARCTAGKVGQDPGGECRGRIGCQFPTRTGTRRAGLGLLNRAMIADDRTTAGWSARTWGIEAIDDCLREIATRITRRDDPCLTRPCAHDTVAQRCHLRVDVCARIGSDKALGP